MAGHLWRHNNGSSSWEAAVNSRFKSISFTFCPFMLPLLNFAANNFFFREQGDHFIVLPLFQVGRRLRPSNFMTQTERAQLLIRFLLLR